GKEHASLLVVGGGPAGGQAAAEFAQPAGRQAFRMPYLVIHRAGLIDPEMLPEVEVRRFQEIAAFGVILIFVAPVEAHAAIAALGDALALVERQRQLQAEIAQESIGKRPRRRGLDHYRD